MTQDTILKTIHYWASSLSVTKVNKRVEKVMYFGVSHGQSWFGWQFDQKRWTDAV